MNHQNTVRIAFVGDASSANTIRWCKGLTNAGCDIHFITFNGTNPYCTVNYKIPIPKLPGNAHYFLAIPFVASYIKKINPDIVIGYSASGYGVMAGLASQKPLVISVTGSDILDVSLKRLPIRIFTKKILKKADMITAWQYHMQRAVTEFGIDQNKIYVLSSGIDVDSIQKQSSKENHDQGVGIITTRSINKFYRHDILLDSFKKLNNPSLRLTFAGEGSEINSLKMKAQSLGIRQMTYFPGFIPNKSIGKILGKNNIFISLSPSDGVSASLLEAMAAGLVPIVCDNEANRNWIKDSVNGVLLKNVNPDYIANRIKHGISMIDNIHHISKYNNDIVRKKAHLYENSKLFVNQFRSLSFPGR